MIIPLKSEATNASENLHYVLTRECRCVQRVCCQRVAIGIVVTIVFVVPIVAVLQGSGVIGRDVLFAVVSSCAVMALLAVIVTLCCCRRYIYGPTGRPLEKSFLYFGKYDFDAVHHFVETAGVASPDDVEVPELPQAVPNGPVLLFTLASDDGEMAFCRLMRYEGFGYEPVGPDHLYTTDDAERVRASVFRARRR